MKNKLFLMLALVLCLTTLAISQVPPCQENPDAKGLVCAKSLVSGAPDIQQILAKNNGIIFVLEDLKGADPKVTAVVDEAVKKIKDKKMTVETKALKPADANYKNIADLFKLDKFPSTVVVGKIKGIALTGPAITADNLVRDFDFAANARCDCPEMAKKPVVAPEKPVAPAEEKEAPVPPAKPVAPKEEPKKEGK